MNNSNQNFTNDGRLNNQQNYDNQYGSQTNGFNQQSCNYQNNFNNPVNNNSQFLNNQV